jgi:amidohydrolase
MDALQVQEETDVLYKSVNPGLMHACGHDGHTAGLLGVAMILNELKSELQGNVKLIFQPAEENEGGALPMIEAGVLENPRVDAAFGCHLWGSVKEGNVQIKYGAMMASPDSFRFKIIGRGGHAAMPHLTIDPVMITVQVINQMQSIVSRRINPLLPAVISFTTIHGGETHNVIPNEVEVTGTIRVFDKSLRQWIPETMESTLKHIAEANNASYEFQLMPKFPPLINDKDMTNLAHSSISKVVGIKNVETAILPNMGGEDFAYFAEKVPSSFYFVGIAPNDENHVIHHHPKFSWDDKNLLIVTQTLSQIAYDFLNQ